MFVRALCLVMVLSLASFGVEFAPPQTLINIPYARSVSANQWTSGVILAGDDTDQFSLFGTYSPKDRFDIGFSLEQSSLFLHVHYLALRFTGFPFRLALGAQNLALMGDGGSEISPYVVTMIPIYRFGAHLGIGRQRFSSDDEFGVFGGFSFRTDYGDVNVEWDGLGLNAGFKLPITPTMEFSMGYLNLLVDEKDKDIEKNGLSFAFTVRNFELPLPVLPTPEMEPTDDIEEIVDVDDLLEEDMELPTLNLEWDPMANIEPTAAISTSGDAYVTSNFEQMVLDMLGDLVSGNEVISGNIGVTLNAEPELPTADVVEVSSNVNVSENSSQDVVTPNSVEQSVTANEVSESLPQEDVKEDIVEDADDEIEVEEIEDFDEDLVEPDFSKDDEVIRRYTKSFEYFQERNYRLAIKELKMAIQLDPSNPLLFKRLGSIYYEIGLPTQAVKNWEKALMLDPYDKSLREYVKTVKSEALR